MDRITQAPDDSLYSDPDAWCDWCAGLIVTPIKFDGRFFCGIKCRADYQQAAARPRGDAEGSDDH